jgi:branched-chain amino acid transport system substrate-binding protein
VCISWGSEDTPSLDPPVEIVYLRGDAAAPKHGPHRTRPGDRGDGELLQDSDPAPGGTIQIGTLISVTGDLASQGKDFNESEILAVSEINAQGGVLGRPLALLVKDDETTPEGAVASYGALTGAHVPVIVGPSTSAQVLGIKSAGLFDSARTLTIATTTTSPELTGISPYFARLSPSDTIQGVLLAKLVTDKPSIKTLCVIYRKDSYGTHLKGELQKQLSKRPDIRIVEAPYEADATDPSGAAAACEALCSSSGGGDAGADAGAPACPGDGSIGVVFITFVSDGAVLVNELGSHGFSAAKTPYFMSDGPRDPELLTLVNAPNTLEGALGTAPSGPDVSSHDGDVYRAFQQRYAARYAHPPSIFAEIAYDAVYLAAIGIELAGTVDDPQAVVNALPRLQTGTQGTPGDWKAILDIVHRDSKIDYVGASGPCNFDKSGDLLPPYYYSIWTVSNGSISTLRTETCVDPTDFSKCPQ